MSTNVLIIDDSMTVRAIIEQILSDDPNMRVIGSARDVLSARALIQSHRPNIITLDLAMPGIDGMTFLSELANGAHPPVLVVSSMTTRGSEAALCAIAHGAAACFDKAQLVSHAKEFRCLLMKAMRCPTPSPKRAAQLLAKWTEEHERRNKI